MFFQLLFKNGEAATSLLGKVPFFKTVGCLEYEGVFVLTYIFQ